MQWMDVCLGQSNIIINQPSPIHKPQSNKLAKHLSMASTQVERRPHPQEQIIAVMKNQTPIQMTSDRYITFTAPAPGLLLPATIEAGSFVTFNGFPSKGAVVYTGQNRSRLPTSWLMAWDTANTNRIPPGPNKVFVACGLKHVIDKMTDEEIRKSLDSAVSPVAGATDPITGATVKADLNNLIPSGDALNATFGLVN